MSTDQTIKDAEEQAAAEKWASYALGFRIVSAGTTRNVHRIEFLDFIPDKEPIVRGARPVDPWAMEMWQEMVRQHIDYQKACEHVWALYCAATGETIETFNGMPAGGAVEAITKQRQQLLEHNQARLDVLSDLDAGEYGNNPHLEQIARMLRRRADDAG